MKERGMERSLCLTEEEAMGLLDIVIMSPGDLTPEQRSAVVKLSEFCRQFLRDADESKPVLTLSSMPGHVRPYAA